MKLKFIIAASLGGLAVIMGAFGAHSLEKHISPESLNTWHTGVEYQFYHVLAILIAGILYQNAPSKVLALAARFFIAGIILFSGSLYIISTRAITGFENMAFIGPLTPIGGLFFISGWVCLVIGIIKMKIITE